MEGIFFLPVLLPWMEFLLMSFFGNFTPIREKDKVNFPSVLSSTAKLETSLIC